MDPTASEKYVLSSQVAAITKDDLASLLVSIGDKFRHQAKSQPAPRPIKVVSYGPSRLLISAPHATPHVRQGQPKLVEPMTGGLAIALAQSLDASAILPTAKQLDDPNFDDNDNAPYKQKLASVLDKFQLLVDIHGMKDDWPTDICVGAGDSDLTQDLNQLINDWKDKASQANLVLTVNQPFSSKPPGTVSEFARRHGRQALQVELSAASRRPKKIAETFLIIRQGLDDWLKQIDR